MLFAAILKELKLLSRDLHGLAVLFFMPILFMFIMSVALSKDAADIITNAGAVPIAK